MHAPQTQRPETEPAFSLVELLAVMAIISVLLVAAVPIFSNSSNTARLASREIITAHLQQARAHAIASGTATAIVVPEISASTDLGARSVSLFEVEKDETGNYKPAKEQDASGNPTPEDAQLQRWEKLPGNFHFLTAALVSSGKATLMDTTDRLATNYKGRAISGHFIVFGPSGQIVRPIAGTPIRIAIAQATRSGESLALTQRGGSRPVFELFEVNRLTGRTREVEP